MNYEPIQEAIRRSNLTAGQYRIWLGQQLSPQTPLYNMALAFRLHGAVDAGLFRKAFSRVVAECDALRTAFQVVEDRPQQQWLTEIGRVCDEHDLTSENRPRDVEDWLHDRSVKLFPLDRQLFDSVLLKLDDEEFVWFLNQHHLTTDAWSAALIYERTAKRYAALQQGVHVDLEPLPSYADFVRHECNLRESKSYSAARRFWTQYAVEHARLTEFYGQSVQRGSANVRITRQLDSQQMERLRTVYARPGVRALTEDLTKLNVFLTILLAWLHRVSGQEQLSIGTPTHNRASREHRGTPGLFIELFPIHANIDPADTFASLLKRVAAQSMRSLSHAHLGTSIYTGQQPFNVVLNSISASFGDFAGLPMTPQWIHPGHVDPGHALRVQVHDFAAAGEMTLHFDFNADLVSAHQRERAADHFLRMFDAFLEDIDRPIREVAMAVNADQRMALSFAKPSATLVVQQTIVDMFHEQVRRTPTAVAATCKNETLTYNQLDTVSDALARGIVERGGGVESPVAIYMTRSLEMVVATLGALKAGVPYVPLEPNQPPKRIEQILRDANCGLVVTRVDDRLKPLPDDVPRLAMREPTALAAGSGKATVCGEAPDASAFGSGSGPTPAGDTAAYIMYTSGSTGSPKGVIVEHRSLAHYIAWAKHVYLDDKPLALPLFTSIGFDLTVTSLFTPLVVGGRIVVYPEDAADDQADLSVLDVFAENQVDVVKLTPSHLALLREGDYRDSQVRKLIVGGEDFRSDLAQTIADSFGGNVEIYNEYGPTEATVGCMIHRFDPHTDRGSSVPIGRPAPHAQIYVLDNCGAHVPTGVTGEICIGGSGVARGYLHQQALTSQRFVNNPFSPSGRMYRSGDLGRWRDDGVLEFLGRCDRQVKVSGVRIELGEIECVLAAHPEVRQCVVDLVDHQPAGRGESGRSEPSPKRCRMCGLPSTHPEAQLLDSGVCSLCESFTQWEQAAQAYFRDLDALQEVLANERKVNPDGRYDCLMLLSGGKDSTYALYQLVKLGARPLVFSLDNGFISEEAKANIRRVAADLELDLEFATTPAMGEIFVDSLKRFSNVCNGCFKTIYTLSANLARRHGIRLIVTGLSRGQIFHTRLWECYRNNIFDPDAVDRAVLEARKAYHRTSDAVSRKLDVQIFEHDQTFDQIQFLDFYRYCDAPLSHMQRFLAERAPWVRPSDTGRSTNCMINAAGIFVHQRERGYHNYAAPYAFDVRLGHKTREEALEELDDDLDETSITQMLQELGYDQHWRKHDSTGKRLGAWYVAGHAIDANSLRSHLAQTLPSYMLPVQFIHLNELPLTANAKIDRETLRNLAPTERNQSVNYVPPRNSKERRLAEIWAEVLRRERIGIRDDFIQLGGDSIRGIQIVARAGREGMKFTPRQLFDHPTIAELADLAAKPMKENGPTKDAPVKSPSFPLSGLSSDTLKQLEKRLGDKESSS